MAPQNIWASLYDTLLKKPLPLPSYKPPFKLSDLPLHTRGQAAQAKDWTRNLSSVLSTFLPAGSREGAARVYQPYVKRLASILASVGLDPESRRVKRLPQILDIISGKRATPGGLEKWDRAFGKYFRTPEGGYNRRLAGLSGPESSHLQELAARYNLLGGTADKPSLAMPRIAALARMVQHERAASPGGALPLPQAVALALSRAPAGWLRGRNQFLVDAAPMLHNINLGARQDLQRSMR